MITQKINYITNLENWIILDLKLLKDEEILDKATYRNIKPVGSRPSNLCGLGIVHKKTKNELPPSCPILSAIGTSFYKLKIFLTSFLTIFKKKMVTPSQTHFVFLKKFSKKTLIYIWLVYMLILYLLTFHWTKPLKNFDCNGILTHNHLVLKQRINHLETGQMVVFITLARIPLRSLRVFFVICLTQPPNNCFLSLRPNSIKKLMVWLWRKN